MSNSLSPESIRALLHSGEWKVLWDAARVTLGEKLARQANFSDLSLEILDNGDAEAHARILEKTGNLSALKLAIWSEQGRLHAESECECEFGRQCEHGAALLAYLSKGDRLARLLEKSPMEATAWQAWLNAYALTLKQPSDEESAIRESCLLYLLHWGEMGAQLCLMRGRILKNGQLGQEIKALGIQEEEGLMRGEDALILEELRARQAQGAYRWPIRGMGWELLLKRLVLTGRLISEADSRVPFKLGEPRSGVLAFHKKNGNYQATVKSSPGSDQWLTAGGLWYVDEARRELGRMVLEEAREQWRIWLEAPIMDETAWRAMREEVQGRDLPLPGLGKSDAGRVRSSLKFRLRVEKATHRGMPDLVAKASVLYDGNELPLSPAQHRRVHRRLLTDGTEQVIERQDGAERQALRELHAIGLEMGVGGESAYCLPRLPDGEKSESDYAGRYWQRFRWELAELMESRGWEIRFAPGIGAEPMVFRADSWKAEMVDEGRGWFQWSVGIEVDGQRIELQPLLSALLEGGFRELTAQLPEGQEFLFFLPDGQGLVLPVGRFRRLLAKLESFLEFRWKPGKPMRLHAVEVAEMEEEWLGATSPAVQQLIQHTRSQTWRAVELELPRGLKAELRAYQLDGLSWMQFLRGNDMHGILADDMGLGKTLQSLALLLMEKESGRAAGKPSLVIAPTSVVMNWQREALKFAPDLRVLVLQGQSRHQGFAEMAKYDLVLSSFALIPRDLEAFAPQEFHYLIVDEAQHLKNPSTQVSQAVRQLKARHRLCLSGTPVENHLGELWSLFDFLVPGLLGTQEEFTQRYRTPIEREGKMDRRDELNHWIGPLILRRTKAEVAKELPPKTEIVHLVSLSETQRELYETVRSTMDKRVRQALAAKGGAEAPIIFLDALLKLRQICGHPSLLEGQTEEAESAKFDYLMDLLHTLLEEGHRVLIFSQFTSMLAIIRRALEELDISYLLLTGETKNRQELVERFQGGEGKVFLISLKAGGTGLTLTAADTVIHYDPWWNPAVENQASDRAYRIGQDKAVMIHKLICEGTVEEKIQQMQGRKHELAGGVLSGALQKIDLSLLGGNETIAP